MSVSVYVDKTDYSNNDEEYTFIFNDVSVRKAGIKSISIGEFTESTPVNSVTIYKKNVPVIRLELRIKYYSTSKMEAKKFFEFVAIGIGAHFYLYDLSNESLMLYITFNGYYCESKIIDECLFICYNSGIYCFNNYGQIKWHNSNLGFDGVYLKGITDGKLIGYTQTNPPDVDGKISFSIRNPGRQ